MLPEVVIEAARRFGSRVALVGADGTETTYASLADQVGTVAGGLRAAGIGACDVVALRLPSTIDYLLAYLGAAYIGAITAGINPKLADPEQDALVDLVSPRLLLDDPAQVRELARVGADGIAPDPYPGTPDTDVAIVFTSGTTGLPKGAVFTNRQLAAITRIDVGDVWGGGGPMIAATQFAHVGIMTKLAWYLRLGCTIHMLDRWTPSGVLRLVAEHRMTSIGGVAPQIALLVRAPEVETLDVSSVQTIIMGGGASSPALVATARTVFDAAYSIRYSSTECGGCGTGTAFDADDDEALHSVGRPRPGVEIQIQVDGVAVPPGTIGEVCLRSDAVMDRYWNDPEATATTIVDGWLHSGDLGSVDDTGLLRLAGRSKEMYIRGGYNVYPMEVEAALADHPAITDVAVVGVPDDVLGERGVACVVAADGTVPTLESVVDHLRGRLATYKFPEAVRAVDALPLTAMQKVDRRTLLASITAADGDRP